MKVLLKPGGVITMEFPHLMRLIDENQFDTIYHEHFSYFSFTTARRVFAAHGLRLFDVEELPTHGGSLRIFGCHDDDAAKPRRRARAGAAGARGRRRLLGRSRPTSTTAQRVAERQAADPRDADRAQARRASGSSATARRPRATRCSTTAASGRDFLDYTVDLNPHKQGHLLPGTHIPIRAPEAIRRGPAGRRLHPALEPQGRDHRAARLHPRVGRARSPSARRSSRCCREAGPDAARGRVRRRARAARRRARAGSRAPSTPRRSRSWGSTRASCSATRRSTRAPARCAGMHYQAEPHGEAKLVRCTRGAVYDVIVDLRPGSPAPSGSGSASSCAPAARRRSSSPAGVAHGFQTLEDDVRGPLPDGLPRTCPEAARGVRWDDPAFGIEWPDPPAAGRRSPSATRAYPDFAP